MNLKAKSLVTIIMLGRYAFAIGILCGWILSGLATMILRHVRGNQLPNGSIVSKSNQSDTISEIDSPKWAKLGVTFAMGGNILVEIAFVFLILFNQWDAFSLHVAWEFPLWLNWIGLVGIWLHLGWGVFVMYYNVNYTPLFRPMPERYVLATGGPYHVVRHPQYVTHVLLTCTLFLVTGTWLMGFIAMGWLALPRQAIEEEKALHRRFGDMYTEYANSTGRFFPIIRHKRRGVIESDT